MSVSNKYNSSFKDLISEFNNIKRDAFNGQLIVQVADVSHWMLCFASGRLSGISGGLDEIDRWNRNLALASLNMPLDRLVKSTNNQEIFSNSNKFTQEYAVKEILFDIIQFSQSNGDRLQYQLIPIVVKNNQIQATIPLLDIQPLLSETIQSWVEWQKNGLASYAPSLFPIIQKTAQLDDSHSDKDFQYLIESIDGTKSLRSLAINHHKKLIDVVKSLLPLIETGTVSLSKSKQLRPDEDVRVEPKTGSKSDLNLRDKSLDRPIEISPQNNTSEDKIATKLSPLIACIDDSITVYKNLEKIITDYGYRCFGVQDPLKIITSLIRNKPDLIFLDLVMPITNGYEVCEQIRKTPSLANVPIVIVTGNDGLIDRVRTKFVGANGFLGKPIQTESVVKMIDKYIKKESIDTGWRSEQMSIDTDRVIQNYQLEVLNTIGKRVLVVDDDRSIREVVSMCLHKLKGWDVLTAASGQDGLNEVQLNNPDVIILDVMMPEMDGLAFLRQLRKNDSTKLIPVVLLTANRYLPDKDLLNELGVVDVIAKPFLPVNLVRQIDKALLN
jgi:two-component system, chemotaxis family, response regulator PixG